MAMNQQRQFEDEGSESEYDSDSDDSENDPSFSIPSTNFSHSSIKNNSETRVNLESESEPDEEEISVQKLDAKDEKSFELLQKVIEAGEIEKLKVEQCKVYLRKNGLRLTGNKDTLIQRIKEHQEILNGGGENKYPPSSFILNCKGDACMGDVVMFEQNVYEMFNLASRSASGPPCGTRIVVGRIVKESYGAAKQQHTFTVEVLWSKGEKPLPPLHPLLIKGRNLYRLRTLRQRWEDEGQRQKALMEKHSRGSLARSDREARMEEKKMRQTLKATRCLLPQSASEQRALQILVKFTLAKSYKLDCIHFLYMFKLCMYYTISMKAEPKKKQSRSNSTVGVEHPIKSRHQQTGSRAGSRIVENQSTGMAGLSQQLDSIKLAGASQPLVGLASNFWQVESVKVAASFHQFTGFASQSQQHSSSFVNSRKSITQRQHAGDYATVETQHQQKNNQMQQMDRQRMYSSSIPGVQHRRSFECHANYNLQQNHIQEVEHRRSSEYHANYNMSKYSNGSSLVQPHRSNNHMNPPQRQLCRHYAQGRCYYGEKCKYLHELRGESPERREEAWRYGRNNLGSRPY